MSALAASAPLEAPSSYDWDRFFAALGDVPATRDTVTVKRKSRDYFWYSPEDRAVPEIVARLALHRHGVAGRRHVAQGGEETVPVIGGGRLEGRRGGEG